MDALGQSYRDIMEMPCGRRRRFAEEKQHIDEWRARRK
jgi:hypothetical protein